METTIGRIWDKMRWKTKLLRRTIDSQVTYEAVLNIQYLNEYYNHFFDTPLYSYQMKLLEEMNDFKYAQ